jgi:hypothetical protein
MEDELDTKLTTLVEAEDKYLYTAEEPDGEITYHLQINNVTQHFFMEEWQDALDFLKQVTRYFETHK